MTAPLYVTIKGLTKRTGTNRSVIMRLIVQERILPAGFVEDGRSRHPLFPESAALTVLRESQLPRRPQV